MKKINYIFIIIFMFCNSLSADTITTAPNVNNTFFPDTLTVFVGDTVTFIMGPSHNAVEVTDTTWINNGTTSNGGFNISYGQTGTFIPLIDQTYYYVCQPHVTYGMKAVIIANSSPIPGCMDSLALNYNLNATVDDGSCLYQSNSVYDIVSNSADHTTLKVAIDSCGLDGYLSGAGPFTLFAPTDSAFNLLPQGTLAALLSNLPQLTDILKHHVVGDSVMSGMLSNNQIVTTLLGTDITVTINSMGVFIDNAMVTVADIIADNGVVHLIDAVLIPASPITTVYDVVANSADHAILKVAIDTCGLDGYLSGAGPFTLFAPTDAAFNALPAGTVTALLNDLPQLTDILKHHVVGATVLSVSLTNNQIVTTLLATDVTVTITSMGVFIDNAMVTVADIVTDNGVVHVIDAVLIPGVSAIDDVNEIYNINYLYSVDILGKKVNRDKRNQIVLDIFENGKIIKRYNQ